MNYKIRNATITASDNIVFKSKLEASVYKHLSLEFNVDYEKYKYILWEGFKPKLNYYEPNKRTKELELQTKKIIDITYTPDFTFTYNNNFYIIEVKGNENDVFPLKKKMFRKILETMDNTYYFEIKTIKQLKQCINIIKNAE